jgi:2'-5' RNA ligase
MPENLLALDLAILPPPDVHDRAVKISASLPEDESQGLRLGPQYLPHVTLTQQFIHSDDMEALFARVDETLRRQPPLTLRITGSAHGGRTVCMAIERTPALAGLHERLMEAMVPFERSGGDAEAFFDSDARADDVAWVTTYRTKSSLRLFAPHITLGHATHAPSIAPDSFQASTVAACHLGRYCSCRRVLRRWELNRSSLELT